MAMWAVALAVGLSSVSIQWRPRWRLHWRNPTASALALAYVAAEFGLPLEFFIFPDIFVLALIYAKSDFGQNITTPDCFIACSYPAVWYFYVAGFHPYYQYWGLYFLAIAQFLAAGWESLSRFRRGYDAVSRRPKDSGNLLVAYPWEARFG